MFDWNTVLSLPYELLCIGDHGGPNNLQYD